MPVVINDFEAVADAPAQGSRGAGSGDAEAGKDANKIDLVELKKALSELRERELRIWAH